MSTKFNMTRDVAGYNGFGLIPSDDSFSGLLATASAQSVTVPNQYEYYIAIFSFTPGTNVFVNFKTTAVTPGSSIAANANELNPAGRLVKGGTAISLITPDTSGAYVTVLFYVVAPFGN